MQSFLVLQRQWSWLFYSTMHKGIHVCTSIHRKWEFLLVIPFPLRSICSLPAWRQAEIAPLACASAGRAETSSRPHRGDCFWRRGADPEHKMGEEEDVLHPRAHLLREHQAQVGPGSTLWGEMLPLANVLQQLTTFWGCEEHQLGIFWLCGHFATKTFLTIYRPF